MRTTERFWANRFSSSLMTQEKRELSSGKGDGGRDTAWEENVCKGSGWMPPECREGQDWAFLNQSCSRVFKIHVSRFTWQNKAPFHEWATTRLRREKLFCPFLCFVIPSTPPLKIISVSEMSICFHYLVTCLIFMFISMLYLFLS